MTESFYQQFHHPLVRDLAWLLSPEFDLLQSLPPFNAFALQSSDENLFAWLKKLENHPTQLEHFFTQNPSHRLGHHFEHLLIWLFEHAPLPHLNLLAHNIPIRETTHQGHTVTRGELDFLLKTGSDTIHLETAVKFYLGVPNLTFGSQSDASVVWLGPGLKDRLDQKIRHMQQHQLPLGQTFNPAPSQHQFWVKGILFHPCGLMISPNTKSENSQALVSFLPTPSGLNASPLTHHWTSLSYCPKVITNSSSWCLLPRARWIGGMRKRDSTEKRQNTIPLQHEALFQSLRQHFEQQSQAVMLENQDTGGRLMVVADDWLQKAQNLVF